ncbi:MAG: hypothetical protein IT436_16850 [Phycisphaerales bacterium]|nr:hypothetical protein [Phycisphaerales bacterium]
MSSQLTNLHVYDDLNHLHMAGFYVPERFSIALTFDKVDGDQTPGAGGHDRGKETESVLSAILDVVQPGYAHQVAGAGWETFILGPPGNSGSRLREWFAGEPSTSHYRVLIHREPRWRDAQGGLAAWERVVAALQASPGSPRVDRRPSTEALRAGVLVLEEGLQAYRSGPDAVRTFIEGLGHPYRHVI